jgi:hypothetical protein
MVRRREINNPPAPVAFSGATRFIADAMLGRLARWLRLLGFDTLYVPHISDSMLLRIAREQDRVILTRDTRLTRRKAIQAHLLIHANDTLKQLCEVITVLKLKHFHTFSRCVACNGELITLREKGVVKDSVPEFVFLSVQDFYRCSECGKIYWEGSHPRKFREKLVGVMKFSEEA